MWTRLSFVIAMMAKMGTCVLHGAGKGDLLYLGCFMHDVGREVGGEEENETTKLVCR